jgi:hypothetical protein
LAARVDTGVLFYVSFRYFVLEGES